jgi:hypothetical protein
MTIARSLLQPLEGAVDAAADFMGSHVERQDKRRISRQWMDSQPSAMLKPG